MACSISITSVTGNGSPTTTTVTVTGTLSGDCEPIIFDPASAFNVRIIVDCGGAPVTATALSNAAGAWSVTVPIACPCGGNIRVTATCATNPECQDSRSLLLPCEEPPPGLCPTVQFTGLSIGNCNPDGTRSVSISALVTPNGSCAAELHDGTPPALDSDSGSLPFTLTGSGNYSGTVTFSVVVTSPAGCSPTTFPLGVPACLICPDVVIDYDIGDCDVGGTRLVTVTADITSTSTCSAELHEPLGTIRNTGSGSSFQLSFTGLYPGGTSPTFAVVITNPTTCGTDQVTIDVPGCNCPSISFDPPQIGDCQNGNRQVTVTANLVPPASAELHDSGGVVASVNPGSTLTHTGTYPSGTNQPFSVVVTSPLGCDGAGTSVTLPSCGGNGGGGDTGWCLGFRIIIAVAGAIAILALLLALCIPAAATALLIIAASFAVLAGIAWFLRWLFGCPDPCQFPLLLSSQIALGAGVGALIFSGCCPWMIFAGLGLTLAGLGGLLLWRSICDKSFCQLAKEIVFVIGGIVLPLVSAILLVPLVAACVNITAFGWVTAVFGPIAIYAATC